MSYLLDVTCPACGKTYPADKPHNLCSCGSSLLVRYDLERAKGDSELFDNNFSGIWRYHKLLPLKDTRNIVTLGEGATPVLKAPNMGAYVGLKHLYVKDEGQNPSSSFKTRGASVAISVLKEFGVTDIVMDSGGNGAGAWSAYCKRSGLNAHIYMTAKAVQANQKECAIVGGDINMCQGHNMILGKKVAKSMEEHPDWFDVRTMHEPYRVEGKKTIGYEIAEQFNGKIPDVILFPTAGGVGIIGIHKAMQELMELGLADKMPRMVSVQYNGCCPVVQAFASGRDTCEAWNGSMDVIPGGLSAPKAFADTLLLNILRKTGGTAVSVSNDDTIRHWKQMARSEGLFVNPEGAATLAACEKLRQSSWLKEDETVLCVMTSNGIKYDELVSEVPNLIAE